MNEREQKIIDSAVVVISRYGFRKTTMSDIAKEAGMSRQTVYAAFASKEDILYAGMRITWENAVTSIRTKCSSLHSLDEKLDVFFQHAVVDFYELINRLPDANDLIAGLNTPDAAAYQLVLEQKKVLLLELLEPHDDLLNLRGQNAESLADFIQYTATNFKYVAKDGEHLRQLLHSLKSAVLALALPSG